MSNLKPLILIYDTPIEVKLFANLLPDKKGLKWLIWQTLEFIQQDFLGQHATISPYDIFKEYIRKRSDHLLTFREEEMLNEYYNFVDSWYGSLTELFYKDSIFNKDIQIHSIDDYRMMLIIKEP